MARSSWRLRNNPPSPSNSVEIIAPDWRPMWSAVHDPGEPTDNVSVLTVPAVASAQQVVQANELMPDLDLMEENEPLEVNDFILGVICENQKDVVHAIASSCPDELSLETFLQASVWQLIATCLGVGLCRFWDALAGATMSNRD
ncbi:hypothetical protein EDD11_005410 [Mortierella claussenii]|nr:hypothetical protein EDD11_005410 [Mortierella claussenii]